MSYTESNWKTSYDSKQNGYYHPHVHFNNNSSSNMLDDQDFKHDSQPMPRKIRTASDRHTDQFNGDHMFENSHPRTTHSTSSELDSVLRHSTNSRLLHEDSDVIMTNGFEHQAFQQPSTRKVTKITPKENYSLSNTRPVQVRSASASTASTVKNESKEPYLTPSDVQRLKNVRRHEPAHVQSGPGAKTSLIKPDSWKTDPVIIKKPPKKKPTTTTETSTKPAKTDDLPKPIIEQSSTQTKPKKPKRDTSAPKPSTTDRTPAKPPPTPAKKEKTREEKEEVKKYIQQKRQEHDEKLSNEKKLKNIQEKERKDKLKKLNEQIKKVAPLPLPPHLLKKSSTSTPPKDLTEVTREKILDLLGPKIVYEPPAEHHRNTPFVEPSLSSSSSSLSSSSSESVVEIQPPKVENQTTVRSHSEPPNQVVEQRHHNLLRWAVNLTRDCNVIEDKIKYLRPDGTQPFDIVPPSHQELQHNDGNLRSQPPILIKKNNKTEPQPKISTKLLRPSGRFSQLNQNRTSEYQGQQLPGVGNLRDPQLERRVKRDHAATKIQAVYRGYTVRKALDWSNKNQSPLRSEFNKRPVQKSKKSSSYPSDILDIPPLKLDMGFSDDNFTIGSTLLRNYQRNGVNIIPSPPPSISEKPQKQQQQPKVQKPSSLQTYSDDYENVTSTSSATPVNYKQILPEKPRVIHQPLPSIRSTRSPTPSSSSSTPSSSSATPTPTPPPQAPSKLLHRRSISPPLPPQMSPDNGRPIHYHHHHHPPPPITTSHRILDERRYSPDALERQLNAELHLLDGVEASMQQIENMERLRSVALAQQEVVSLAQVLKNKPAIDTKVQSKSTARQVSSASTTSSSSSHRKRHSPPPIRSRTTQSSSSPSSSSESILTAREKRLRQKFHNETELQAYEKRLKDIEKKIRLLVKRDTGKDESDVERLELMLKALEIFDEKRKAPSPRPLSRPPKSSHESSISEDLPVSHSTIRTIKQKTNDDLSEIHTEPIRKGSESSIASLQQQNPDIVTTDASDIERRIRNYHDQLKAKKTELDKLKQRKNKDALRRQEDELKKQLQTYNHEIETLRHQPTSPKVSVPSRKSPVKSRDKSSSSSSSTTSTATKQQESSIAEELPASSTTSQSKTPVVEKRIEPVRPTPKKVRDFFDDDDEEEVQVKKPSVLKPLETPREERDTHHDAQSLSIATDIAASSETENDDSRRPSVDNGHPILNLNTSAPVISKFEDDFESSFSTASSNRSRNQQVKPLVQPKDDSDSSTSEKISKQQVLSEQKPLPISNRLPSKVEYDSEASLSTTISERSHKPQTQLDRPASVLSDILPAKSRDDSDSSSSSTTSEKLSKQQVLSEQKSLPLTNPLPSKAEDDSDASLSSIISDRGRKPQNQFEQTTSLLSNLLPAKSKDDDSDSSSSTTTSEKPSKQQPVSEQKSLPLTNLLPSKVEDDLEGTLSGTLSDLNRKALFERTTSLLSDLLPVKSKDDDSDSSSSTTTTSEKSSKQQPVSEQKSLPLTNLLPSKPDDDFEGTLSGTLTDVNRKALFERTTSLLSDLVPAKSKDDDSDFSSSTTTSEKPSKQKPLPSLKPKEDSESSSSKITSIKSPPKPQITSERKSSPITNDYDEDFSEVSRSPASATKEPLPKSNIDDIDIESIQEDLQDKHSAHDTNRSLSSKSSADEQSEILVLNKKSANNTPRRQDDKTPEQELHPIPTPPVLPPLAPLSQPTSETNNDDTSHDISEDEETAEQENKIDKLTDVFIRTFIDEAIDQGKQIKHIKKEINQQQNIVKQEVHEWVSDDEDLDNDEPIPQQTNVKSDELTLDLSELDLKNPDERRVESPRKPVIEEPIKPLVPHTHEQVVQLSHDALQILLDQNTDFSNRENIRRRIPDSYFTSNQQDSDNEDIRRNNHAYCQMIFDLCADLLHEIYTENVQHAQYPDWQKSKLVSKRFYRGTKPRNRQEIEQFIQTKILEILNLNPRQITYSKWRVSNGQRQGIEKFEKVLDDEIRRTESQWVNYDDDCTQLKFDVADLIFDQLIQETLTECCHVINKRLYMSSNSTRF